MRVTANNNQPTDQKQALLMGKPSLGLIISLAIITIFIFSAHLNNAQSLKYQPAANLSTTWINNNPIFGNSSDIHNGGFTITPVLSLSNTSHFISGFYCFPNDTSCFFGIVIFAERYDYENLTWLDAPQLVWSANRDRPVKVNAILKLTGSGDLILEDADGDIIWSTDTGGKSVTGLRFSEFGNLVLFDKYNTAVWQSFDHPTDSLLLGQKLVSGQKLIAKTSSADFSRGLFWLLVRNGSLLGYLEANPPVVYYKYILDGISKFTNLEEEYVAFENGSFNGQNIPLASTAQFMRLEPDGHLKVYDSGGGQWKIVADLLDSEFDDCGYPTVCGKYGICSNGPQCGCLEGSDNEIGNFKPISYKQPNLGCSLVTPISCDYSQHHSLLELTDTSYFVLNLQYNNELDEKTGLQDCKNACLRNCSCKAALFAYQLSDSNSRRGCLLISEVFTLINSEGGYNNVSVFLKVQNSPTKKNWSQINFPRKKSRSGTIVLGSSFGAFFGLCLLVGSCFFIFKRKREPKELDEFLVDNVPGMPSRFSYDDLKNATNDFHDKLGEGGFGSVFQGTLSDGTKLNGAEVVEMMRLAVWCLQGDFNKRASMSVVVKVLEGSMNVENNLEYSFTTPAVPRTIAAAGHVEGVINTDTRPLPSTLSGPRELRTVRYGTVRGEVRQSGGGGYGPEVMGSVVDGLGGGGFSGEPKGGGAVEFHCGDLSYGGGSGTGWRWCFGW
ncbi:hypothetical protein RHGRI_017390 [Rhododendron griersonianum]|uniref:Receptor-like serine/threonine-protein kinase n=1 Tax=Rhododendron griersonianum TaxID=479676 RepID=A0AAV6JXL1_9ERIC|nr:hypothetical protein RHGRI_017390 [Rhododendron griersonianum]